MNGEFILGNNVAWGVSEDLSDCKKGKKGILTIWKTFFFQFSTVQTKIFTV